MYSMCADAAGGGDSVEAGDMLAESELPDCVRDALAAVRAARPDVEVTCVSFRTLESGRESARIGPDPRLIHGPAGSSPRLRAKNLLVLSVTITQTTFAAVQSVTHVLVARTCPRVRGRSAQPERS